MNRADSDLTLDLRSDPAQLTARSAHVTTGDDLIKLNRASAQRICDDVEPEAYPVSLIAMRCFDASRSGASIVVAEGDLNRVSVSDGCMTMRADSVTGLTQASHAIVIDGAVEDPAEISHCLQDLSVFIACARASKAVKRWVRNHGSVCVAEIGSSDPNAIGDLAAALGVPVVDVVNRLVEPRSISDRALVLSGLTLRVMAPHHLLRVRVRSAQEKLLAMSEDDGAGVSRLAAISRVVTVSFARSHVSKLRCAELLRVLRALDDAAKHGVRQLAFAAHSQAL